MWPVYSSVAQLYIVVASLAGATNRTRDDNHTNQILLSATGLGNCNLQYILFLTQHSVVFEHSVFVGYYSRGVHSTANGIQILTAMYYICIVNLKLPRYVGYMVQV